MRKSTVFALLLLLLALLLYFLPQSVLLQSRLAIYSVLSRAKVSLGFEDPTIPHSAALEIPLRTRIDELSQRLMQQEAKIARLQSQLRSVMKYKESFPRTHFESVQVLSYGADGVEQAVTIDRGTKDGLAVGQGVVLGQALVGRVVETGPNASLVLLITAPGSIIPVRSVNTKKVGSLHGQGLGQAYAVFYSSTTDVEATEGVVTSGLLGQLPQNLVIGKLQGSPRKGREPGTIEVDVSLMADMTVLQDLLVIDLPKPAADTGRVH